MGSFKLLIFLGLFGGQQAVLAQSNPSQSPLIRREGHYADVNGLKFYYEMYGQGKPLILLPGTLSGIGTGFGQLIPFLSTQRQVIAVEFQGYGHTADIPDRPLSYEQFTSDVLGLLDHLGIKQCDIFGYSTGAGVALRVALARPALVDRLILASVMYHQDGRHQDLPKIHEAVLNPQAMAGSAYEQEHLASAPRPHEWATLIAKVKEFEGKAYALSEQQISKITAPALIITADADIVRLEHTVKLYRLLGGGSIGEVARPATRLAILPGTMHTNLTQQTDLLKTMLSSFLNATLKK
ncbi:alpha/beta fold hydrolase [Pedobacter sp. SYP-B3415]|uniref:alpha/beta fold hydrolase n=1 Tax=Pedobacter sp. SYP-B3415 TaxID=2496641 RepID=UPI0013ED3F03|nr:alpha/beta hydrolase [Pedobacter sp. SYP-B3415]